LFRASKTDDDFTVDFEPSLGWDKFAAGELDIVEVPGDHYTVMSNAAIQIVAPMLMREMDLALRSNSSAVASHLWNNPARRLEQPQLL
jgi:thioesterase domain-containing protein